MNYPKREPFFAHKFVRLLTKSCAAQDIGLNAFALLCVIAHQEDSARYSGPVRFWNEQLMNVLGFKSPKQLNDCRAKAIQFGWLRYERSGNREVGRYAVVIPDAFEGLDDSQIESNHSVNHSTIHSESGMNKERITERLGDGSRNESVTESGKPSVPIPSPIPVLYTPGPDVVIPERINTEQFREAIGRWVTYTRSSAKLNGKPIESNSMEEQELWRMVATWKTDAESLSEAVSAAIVGGWANLRRPTAAKPHTHTKFTKFSEEFLEAVKAAQRYPSDYETRQQVLGAEKFEALKRTGTAKVANATDSQLTSLGEIFDSHLRDIRQELRV
jgi:hypothetical protein